MTSPSQVQKKRKAIDSKDNENKSKKTKINQHIDIDEEIENPIYNIRYGGWFTKDRRNPTTIVFGWWEEGRKRNKSFSIRKHGTAKKAQKAAQKYREAVSERLGRTNKSVANSPIPIQQFVAGFMDSDGSIIYQSEGNSLTVVFGQSQNSGIPDVLTFIQKYYGGHINGPYEVPKKSGEGFDKDAYRLVVGGFKNCLQLLKDLSKHIILKADQVLLALELIDAVNKKQVERYQEFEDKFKLAHQRSSYLKIIPDASRLTPAYISGFNDGDGSCFISLNGEVKTMKFEVDITQSNSLKLLHCINKYFDNSGYIGETAVRFSGTAAFKVLDTIRQFSIVKREQIDAMYEARKLQVHHPGNSREVSEELKEKRIAAAETVCALKHA
jgi:hypothetical protein